MGLSDFGEGDGYSTGFWGWIERILTGIQNELSYLFCVQDGWW